MDLPETLCLCVLAAGCRVERGLARMCSNLSLPVSSRMRFIGLSSGYDSGAIHVALVNDQIGHFAYTVYSTEDMDILKERIGWAGNWTETNVIES